MLKKIIYNSPIYCLIFLSACSMRPVTSIPIPNTALPSPDAGQRLEIVTPTLPEIELEALPTETAPPIPSSPMVVIRDHSQARDAAMQHVLQIYNLLPPDTWSTEDITPENTLGAFTFRYTSGAWLVLVSAPIVAPDKTIYTVVIDHLASGLHWEGMVNAFGDIAEVNVTPPAQVDTLVRARDQVLIYLQQKYGLSLPGNWTFIDTPQTMIGATRYRYTSGPWVVNVVVQAGAPLASVYQVTLDNLDENIKWQGEVTSQGVITERSFTQGQ